MSGSKYHCPECSQGYGSTAALKAHVKSHSAELAFRCQICGRHFSRLEECLAHKSKMHPPRSRQENPTGPD